MVQQKSACVFIIYSLALLLLKVHRIAVITSLNISSLVPKHGPNEHRQTVNSTQQWFNSEWAMIVAKTTNNSI